MAGVALLDLVRDLVRIPSVLGEGKAIAGRIETAMRE